MSQQVYEGKWNDGEQAGSLAVTVAFEPDGLSIRNAAGEQISLWTFKDLRPATPIAKRSRDVLLRNASTPRVTLFASGDGIGKLLLASAPQTSQGLQRLKVVKFSLIATALVVAAGAFLLFGRFSASKAIAGLIPYATADKIGSQSIEVFGPIAPACIKQPGNAALESILERLQRGSDYGRPFKLHVAKSRIANAFALPGRHIILLSALVKQAKSPEEVAGILAHEMGHGIEKDPESHFVRNIGMQALTQLLAGQSGNQSAFTLGSLLLQLRYSRAAERSADSHAVEILRNAHVEPKPTGEFFLKDAAKSSDDEKTLDYLSTHPSSKERAKLFLSQPAYQAEPILSEKEWADAQAICGEIGVKKPKEEQKKPDKPKTQRIRTTQSG